MKRYSVEFCTIFLFFLLTVFFGQEKYCISNTSGFSSHNSSISDNKDDERSVLVMSDSDLRQVINGEKVENTIIGGPASNYRGLRNQSILSLQLISYSRKDISLLRHNIIITSNSVNRSPISEILRI